MNSFDAAILGCLNGFARTSWRFDYLVNAVSSNHLLKGGIIVAVFWWAWFRHNDHDDLDVRRARLLATLVACLVAEALARGLALTLPFRARPLHNPSIHFLLPYAVVPTVLESWSSFPSDHAVLFFALATGIWLVAKPAGRFAFAYVLLVICLPRVYLGLHYPTDILGGAALGITVAWLANTARFRKIIAQPALRWAAASPGTFYAGLMLLSIEIADLFDHVQAILSLLHGLARG